MRKFEAMKKQLSLLLCAVLVMGMLPMPALAAEGDSCTSTPDCTGTYDANGICMVCGAAAPAAGDGAGDSDNEETCQHSGGTATCTAQAVCELCGAPYGELADHAYGTDADGKCDVCGADCAHAEYAEGVCTVCGGLEPVAPTCVCEVSCGGDNGINPNCVVCLEDFWNCTHFVPTCSCAEKCTVESVNFDCGICGQAGTDLSQCKGNDVGVTLVTYRNIKINDKSIAGTEDDNGNIPLTSANEGYGITAGTVTYNNDKKTLTLNGATINVSADSKDGINVMIDLTLHLEGTNSIAKDNDVSGTGLVVMGNYTAPKNLTVTGTGSLIVNAPKDTAVKVTGDFTVNGASVTGNSNSGIGVNCSAGKLNIDGGHVAGNSTTNNAVQIYGDISVSNGSLTGIGCRYGVLTNGGIRVTNGSLTGTSTATSSAEKIYSVLARGTAGITVENSGSLIATNNCTNGCAVSTNGSISVTSGQLKAIGIGKAVDKDISGTGYYRLSETAEFTATTGATAPHNNSKYFEFKTSAEATTYTITIDSDIQNGTVIANPTSAAEGDTVTLTVTPAEGYELDTLTIVDADNGTVTVTDNKFTMPAKNVTVTATFKEHTHTPVYVTDDEKDTITLTCSGSADGACGFTEETVTLTAPDSLVADGKAKQFTYTGSITGVTPQITYGKDTIPKTAGTYTVTMSITVEGETYSVSREYTILEGLKVSFSQNSIATTKTANWTPILGAFDTGTGIHFLTSGLNNKDSVVSGGYTVQWYDAENNLLSEAPTDAGTYTIKVTLSDSLSETCALQGDTLTYKINPMDLSTAIIGLYFEGGYPVYTGQKADLSNAYVGNSSYRLDKSEYTLEYDETDGDTHINAGQGRKLKIIGNGKNVTGETIKTYNIGKASLTLPDAEKKSYIYGQTPEATDFTGVTLPDGVGSIEVSSWHSSTGKRLTEVPTDVGEYRVYLKYVPTDTVNYNSIYRFEYFEITPRKLTANVNLTTSKTYDSWPNAQVSCTPTNVVEGDSILLTAMAAYDSADVGTGKTITVTFQLSGSDKKNYTVPDNYTVTTGEITPKTVTVSPERFTVRFWDGTNTVPLTKNGWTMTGQYTSDGLTLDLTNATAKVETSDAGQNKPVIFENVVVNGNDKGNYKIEVEQRTITIQKLNLGSGSVTVTFTGDTTVYTGSTVYPKNAVVTVKIQNQGTITLDNSLWEFTPDTGMNNTNAGTAYAWISATDESGNVTGKTYIQYTIDPVSLADAVVTVDPNADLTYTGSEIEPEVIVKLGDKTLVKDTDYTVTYKQNGKEVTPINAGTYDVVITGKNNYSGTVTKTFTIEAKSLTSEDITVSMSDNVIFEGQPTPTVTVKDGDTVLTKDTDYTVSQTESDGEFTLTITGTGNYKGTYGSTLTYLEVTLPDPDKVEPYDEDAIDAYNRYTELNKKYQDAELAEKLEELQKALTDYKITKGHKSSYVKGSYKTLTFTANGPVSKFSYIKVDGKQVDAKYYTVASDNGTVITLHSGYLETLSAGKHTIQVFYADGKTDTATFRISINNGNPITGDDHNMLLFGGVAMASLLCMAMMVMFYPRKKGKHQR